MNLQTLATTQKTNKQKTTDFSQLTQRNKENTTYRRWQPQKEHPKTNLQTLSDRQKK